MREAHNYTAGWPAPFEPAAMKYSPPTDDVFENILAATKDHPLGEDSQILFRETNCGDLAEDDDYKREK